MAVQLSQPLGHIMAYDPSFKVEISQCEPLYDHRTTEKDVLLDVMAVSAQLDFLVRKELSMTDNGRIDHGRVSRSFETKAMVMMKRINTYLQRLPAPPTPEDYMDLSGLGKLYPRAAAYITRPEGLSVESKTTSMDGYYAQLGGLHQLITLAHQINSDVTNLSNHKYLAHQLALLHQALAMFGDNDILTEIKRSVEDNFETFKAGLSPGEAEQEVQLSREHAQWVLEVTCNIVQEAASLPQNIASKILLPSQVLLMHNSVTPV